MNDNDVSDATLPGAAPIDSPKKLRLLVVDDDPTQRQLIARAGRQAGNSVTIAASVAEATDRIRSERFDCITLDLMLPDGIGIEVLDAMSHASFDGLVILVSGTGADVRSAARVQARTHGFDVRSLPKPLDLSALRVCLADRNKSALSLPPAHTWGGILVKHECERHRLRNPFG